MRFQVLALTSIASALLVTSGCTGLTGTVKEKKYLDGGDVLLTSADVRVYSQMRPKNVTAYGQVEPEFLTCAEPSPDVAKALSASVAFGAALTANLPNGVTPEVAAAITKAGSESMAQLGERLATIQLLRDSLYRACEAYRNGAITSAAYAVMLGRYDDTMITMEQSELAAGAFGRTLAAASGSAEVNAAAKLNLNRTREELDEQFSKLNETLDRKNLLKESLTETLDSRNEMERSLKESIDLVGNINKLIDAANAAGDDTSSLKANRDSMEKMVEALKTTLATNREITENLKTTLAREETSVKKLKTTMNDVLEAAASGKATSTGIAAGGIEPGKQSPAIAETLRKMQENYLGDINTDGFETACVVALDRNPAATDTALATLCKEFLPEALKFKRKIIGQKFDLDKMALLAKVEGKSKSQATATPRFRAPLKQTRPNKLSSSTVMRIQESLNTVANAKLPVDGVYGHDTRAAVRKFQGANGLSVDGIPGPATRAKLFDRLLEKAS